MACPSDFHGMGRVFLNVRSVRLMFVVMSVGGQRLLAVDGQVGVLTGSGGVSRPFSQCGASLSEHVQRPFMSVIVVNICWAVDG